MTIPRFPGDYIDRHGLSDRTRAADAAIAKGNMLIGMICENMIAGRESFFGTSQFIDGSDPFDRSQQGGSNHG